MLRVLLASVCLIICVVSWLLMGVLITLSIQFRPGDQLVARVPIGLQKSVEGQVVIVATILCLVNALSQYGARHAVRRIMEEGEPNPRGGFHWVRALQSVLIAWGLLYATLIWHCVMWTG